MKSVSQRHLLTDCLESDKFRYPSALKSGLIENARGVIVDYWRTTPEIELARMCDFSEGITSLDYSIGLIELSMRVRILHCLSQWSYAGE